MLSLTTPSLIAANAVAGVVILGFAWFGIRELRIHSWARADRHRRAVRARILEERRMNDNLRGLIYVAEVRAEATLAAYCDLLLETREMPERLLEAVRA